VQSEEAVVVPLVITIEDQALHRSHFHRRGRDGRPRDRYLENFAKIRRIQDYMMTSAAAHGVPMAQHYDLDATLGQVIDHIMAKAMRRPRESKLFGDLLNGAGLSTEGNGDAVRLAVRPSRSENKEPVSADEA
jgi:2-phosphoglycerate kinase